MSTIDIETIISSITTIVKSAFGMNAAFGGIVGGALLQGIKRGTFSSAAGMGESTPAASAAETSHPVKQGMANAAGVWLDTIIVCSATGFMILLTDCFNVVGGIHIGQGAEKEGIRKSVTWILRAAVVTLVFIFGIVESSLAWDLSDLALGACTWVNVFMLWFLFPKTRELYKDYTDQLKVKQDPYYDPDKLSWPGVDKDLWREINKTRIMAGK